MPDYGRPRAYSSRDRLKFADMAPIWGVISVDIAIIGQDEAQR